ncbi:46418_t:CDS:2 [Gigaspora margarita]|uniref:46418_t:CDS:1 n=1 Tax=Gigaspora margarita TaxID=4874 RepID=A0ABN7V599_GIGMA|nr:46418_t:CDS:2 [Gigaspora margarita]
MTNKVRKEPMTKENVQWRKVKLWFAAANKEWLNKIYESFRITSSIEDCIPIERVMNLLKKYKLKTQQYIINQ